MGRRFLFINQFYPPDPAPTGRLLHEVATELVRRGHYVRVLCSRKEYGTGRDLGGSVFLDGVDVCRVRATPFDARGTAGRMADDGLFLLQAALRAVVRSPRADLVLAASSPPLIGVVAALAHRSRGVAHAHWTMDVYPDVLEAHGRVERGSWRSRALKAIARFQFDRAALILTLGPFMAERVAMHLGRRDALEAVPLWSDLVGDEEGLKEAEQVRRGRGWSDDLVLLYSGNMGRGHRFGEFLDAARHFGPEGPVWAFVGGGPRRGEVESHRHRYPSARVQLLPSVEAPGTAASLLSGDVHLVSLAAEWQALIVPSKLQAAFALGRPVIFVGPPENEIASWVGESGGGWVVAEGDVAALIQAVEEARDPEERERRGRAARDFSRHHFDREANRARVADLLEACASRATDASGGRP